MAEELVQVLKNYLIRMAEIRGTGGAVPETSYYSAFENMMNAVGESFNPKIICNAQLKSLGAGHPDFGLYSKSQCSAQSPKENEKAKPECGAVEVKGVADDNLKTALGEQSQKYLEEYRLLLVTNYREFRLMALDGAGKPEEREHFSLADNADDFWKLAAAPQSAANELGKSFIEFIKRVMMHKAPLTRAEDVAQFLASYAREALAKVESGEGEKLEPLRKALQTALGIAFEGKKGEHFFRSTLIQSLFYGIFSAWVICKKKGDGKKFDWRSAGYILTVPMIRALFAEIAKPTRLQPLGIEKILDRTVATLDRVDTDEFFKSFGAEQEDDAGQAVQHFYEPFLAAYDNELRKDYGVWYTPPEIVKYMVERVDRVLRSELGIADGLADKNVYVLDPCCGTGAYVVEVLKKITETLRANGGDALIGDDVKEAAQNRVFGFEIMPAPFVIAHWRIDNLLTSLGTSFDTEQEERPAVFLTNALTGWKPPTGPKATIELFKELEEERDRAERVKRDVPVLVVIGNPPYNAFAGTSPEEEQGLVGPYKKGLREKWGIGKYNLDDLYIRFYRLAERRIAETGRGVISYISNHSYTSEPSFVVMREHLLKSFDKFWIENMHGDRTYGGEYAPDGRVSETIFAIKGFSVGIKQGVVISLAAKTGKEAEDKLVRYRNDINASSAMERRQQLLESLNDAKFDELYETANPEEYNKLSFKPSDVGTDYLSWPLLKDLADVDPINGLLEGRGGALIDMEHGVLAHRMQEYFSKSIDWDEFQLLDSPLAKNVARFNAKNARTKAREEPYEEKRIVRYFTRPFDIRYAYYTEKRPVWNEARPALWAQYSVGNKFLVARPAGVAKREGVPVMFTRCLGDYDSQNGHAKFFPLKLSGGGMAADSVGANLSDGAISYLSNLGFGNFNTDEDSRNALWLHTLAIAYAPEYRNEHTDGIALDWPRIPLPNDRQVLDHSVEIGSQLASLLDTEIGPAGITSGSIVDHLKIMGVISSADLNVSANWSSKDKKGRVNPGKGKTESRAWTADEKKALEKGFKSAGLQPERSYELLGQAVDVYLNQTNFWKGVPESVWNYRIGGYQVIKKWLSYREYGTAEKPILGRAMTKEEAREVTAMVRRIAAIVLMTDALDENYKACRDCAQPLPSGKA